MATPRVASVEKAFEILNCLSGSARMLTIAEISANVGLTYKTAHRFLITLEQIGAVTRIHRSHFTLGVVLADLGRHVALHRALKLAAMPELQRLTQRFDVYAQVAVRSGDGALSVAHVSMPVGRGGGIPVGTVMPLHCTAVGKVLVANLEDGKLKDLLRVMSYDAITPHTLVSKTAYADHIAQVRAAGYAFNDMEFRIDISAMAAPIHSLDGDVLAALSVSGTPGQMARIKADLVAPLKEAADRISTGIYTGRSTELRTVLS